MEPDESRAILCGEIGHHQVEGIPVGSCRAIYQRHKNIVDEVLLVSSKGAVAEMCRLAREYGLFVGSSSGVNMLAAYGVRETYPDLNHIVRLFCGEGENI